MVEAKAWDEAADRRRGAGQELRRQARRPLRLRHQRPGHLRHRHADRQGGRAAALSRRPTSSGTGPSPSRTPGATASPPCRSRTRAARIRAATTRTSPSSGCWRPSPTSQQRILLTLATGTGKTFIAFQIAWKLFHSRWNLSREPIAPPAHPVPGRPQHPRRPGLQRLLRLPRGRAGADRAGRHPQEGQGAEERQPVLHDLPDLHERPAEGRQARRPTSASIRRTSSISSSSTSAIAAAPTTRATGAASWSTSRRPCSSA